MKYIMFLILTMLVMSCVKQEPKPQLPLAPQPIITDSTLVDSTLTIKEETWVITKVMYTDYHYENRSDTLYFIDKEHYTFNGDQSLYDLDLTSTYYILTFYDTDWGHLTGKVYLNQIYNGELVGVLFTDYMDNTKKYRLWLKRI